MPITPSAGRPLAQDPAPPTGVSVSFRVGALLVAALVLVSLVGGVPASDGAVRADSRATPPAVTSRDTTGTLRVRTGTLVEVHGDDFARGVARPGFGLQGPRPRDFVTLSGVDHRVAHRLVGADVRVTGRSRRGARLAVAEGGLVLDRTTRSRTSSPDPAAGTAVKRVAVVLVAFADSTATPPSRDGVTATMFTSTTSVDRYYQDVSDGAWSVTGDVLGAYTVARSSSTSCDYATWGNAARTAAGNAGVDLSTYQHVMFVWPRQSACSWSGMGQLPGATTWINGSATLRTMAHELGHNWGVHHASTASCTQDGVRVAVPSAGSSCTVTEYGDPFTVMGASSTYLHHNVARSALGLMSATTLTPGQSSIVDLVPVDATGDGVRLLRVPRGDGTHLALEFRQPGGAFDTFAATTPVANGVGVRIDQGAGGKQTRLLDTTPSTSSFSDATMAAGRSMTDPLSGATLTVTSVSPAGAQVSVTYNGVPTPPADTTAPSTPTGLVATVTSSRVDLGWEAAVDDVGVAGYQVSRDGVLLGTTTSRSWTDTAVTAGRSFSYEVVAVDAAGNRSAGSTTDVAVPAPAPSPPADTTPPSAVESLTAVVAKGRTVTLTWSRSTDDVGVVGYRVGRSGSADEVVTTTSWSRKLSGGNHVLTVRAADAAGNLSPVASVSVVVR